ncbi:hypothetical protein V8E36_006926, partial [Tilletia maclaganii]
MASTAADDVAPTGSALTATAAGSIISDSVTLLVDGSFADHLLELAPFLARAVQPTDSRQAFVDGVRKHVRAVGSQEGDDEQQQQKTREALEVDAEKRISVLGFVVNALKTLPEPAKDIELEGAFNLLLTLILTSPAPSSSSSNISKEQTDLLVRLAEIVGTAGPASSTAAGDKSIVKYRILTNIFNALPAQSSVRLTIFLRLLSLAAASDDLDVLSSSSAYASASNAAANSSLLSLDAGASGPGASSAFSSSVLLYSLPAWLAQWQLDEARKSEVLKQVADILLKRTNASSSSASTSTSAVTEETDPADAARTLAFHKLYLRFLDAASVSESYSADVQQAALNTLALALRLPHVYDLSSLLESKAVRGLEKSQAGVWELLVGVVLKAGGRGKAFEAWKGKNGDVLGKLGVSEAVLVRKIRLLDIASLCAAQVYSDAALAAASANAKLGLASSSDDASQQQQQQQSAAAAKAAEVPYSLIASEALPSEPADDVETWVIDVIRAGLVSGKLSQVNEVFRVYRVSSLVPLGGSEEKVEEVFSRKQWEVLERKLAAWRESVGRMLGTLNSASKQQQAAIVAAVQAAQTQNAGSSEQQQVQQHQPQAQAV